MVEVKFKHLIPICMYVHFHRHQRGLMHSSQLLSYLKDAYAERSHVSALAVCAYPFYIHISNVYFTFWPHVRWKDPVHLYESICYVRIGWNERILLSTRILLYLVGFFCVLARLRISISIFTYIYVYLRITYIYSPPFIFLFLFYLKKNMYLKKYCKQGIEMVVCLLISGIYMRLSRGHSMSWIMNTIIQLSNYECIVQARFNYCSSFTCAIRIA